MNQGHSMLPTAEAQVGRLEQFHEVLDYGLDVYNPIDKPSNLYITDQSETARALADVTTLLDEIVPQRRLVISRRQETSQGVIRRIPNKKTPVIESCINLTEDDFRGYKVDPDMRVVLDLNREMAVRVLTGRRLHEHVGGITVHDHYLKYLRELKRRLSASEILQFRRQQVVREQRRADSITGAVSEALSLCRKARLVRVDGSYKQSVRRNKTPECISNDLDRFIRNMRHNKILCCPPLLCGGRRRVAGAVLHQREGDTDQLACEDDQGLRFRQATVEITLVDTRPAGAFTSGHGRTVKQSAGL